MQNLLETYSDSIFVEIPKNRSFGDFSTNVAMVLAKPMQSNPRAIANTVTQALSSLEEIESCEVAGPGFILRRVKDSLWDKLVDSVIFDKENYGTSDISKNEKDEC